MMFFCRHGQKTLYKSWPRGSWLRRTSQITLVLAAWTCVKSSTRERGSCQNSSSMSCADTTTSLRPPTSSSSTHSRLCSDRNKSEFPELLYAPLLLFKSAQLHRDSPRHDSSPQWAESNLIKWHSLIYDVKIMMSIHVWRQNYIKSIFLQQF